MLEKITLTISILLLGTGQHYAQVRCTDPFATNFNSEATQNDGSCTYDSVLIAPVDSYSLNTKLAENSGLIYWNDALWTHNDNGDTNLYGLDPSKGSIKDSISLDSVINRDWEEISQDEDYVYIGDFGNNITGNRRDLNILKISKSSILAKTPAITVINFAYEDQIDFSPKPANSSNFDCEAFIITENAIFLFTKQWIDNKTRVYKLPKMAGTYQAELQETFDIKGLVTGAVYTKETGVIALSGYTNFLQPFIFLLYDFEGTNFFGANKRRLDLNLPFFQVEGITTIAGLNYFVSNEKFDTTGTIQHLHIFDLSAYLVKEPK